MDELDRYRRIAKRSEKKLSMARSKDRNNIVFVMEDLKNQNTHLTQALIASLERR